MPTRSDAATEEGPTRTPTRPERPDWYAMTVDDVFDELEADRDGLSQAEADQRLQRHGPNRVREQEEVGPWHILLRQFRSPLIYVLLAALVVTAGIQAWSDAIVIAAVLVINATIGFFQEYRAESAVRSLMEMVSPRANVVRDGARRRVEAEELVPGDVVEIDPGEVVPADLRLTGTEGLQVDEAPLTGESVPVDKATEPIAEEHLPPADQRNLAFMGTAVTSGRGRGVVVATGSDTEIGQIAEQVEEAEESETPLQLRIDRLARWITAAILGVAVVAAGVGVLLGRDVFEMLLLGVALAVAAIPEGLPIVVTVALAVGVRRMAERRAVIRKLHAVDTLGSCSAILSDKTGTLTQNRMAVRAVVAGGRRYDLTDGTGRADGEEPARGEVLHDDEPVSPDDEPVLVEAVTAGVLCNDVEIDGDGQPSDGDPMEVALVAAAVTAGMSPEDVREAHPRQDTVPFRTEQRYMATIHGTPGGDGPLVVVKGAPERVLEMCERGRTADGDDGSFDLDDVRRRSESLAGEGFRVLAVAVGHGDDAARAVTSAAPRGLTFVGMHGLLDPPRQSAIDAVARCHEAGIRVVMITGDHATTAAAIASQVGIGTDDELPEAITGQDLAGLGDDGFDARLEEIDVYARVAPGQKLRIVERLKAHDRIVAVTGDGVNDAPALESAHIGAAMGSGTDVAKEASDMVITDDDFASVYAAVEEGRTAFRNIRMATFFLLSTGLADVLIILSALGLAWPLPLLPAQILWVNVVTNGIADVALAFEPGERSLFRRPPRPKDEGVLGRNLLGRLVLIGLWLSVGTAGAFWWSWDIRGDGLDLARTVAVTTLVLFQSVHVFNCRGEHTSVFRRSPAANRILLAGVVVSVAAHVGAMYWSVTQDLLRFQPLDATAWLVCIAVAASAILPNELHKRSRGQAPR